MKKIKRFILILLVLLSSLCLMGMMPKKITSKYCILDLDDWVLLNTTDDIYSTPEEFLSEADYYVEKICNYFNIKFEGKIKFVSVEWNRARYNGNRIIIGKKLFQKNIYPLAHEITHVVLYSSHPALSEGLAELMQETYGRIPSSTALEYPIHNVTKAILPYCSENLINSIVIGGVSISYLSFEDRLFFYTMGHSFVKFLIDNYGNDLFLKYFLHPYQYSYKDIFGKNAEELKNKWISYVQKQEAVNLKNYGKKFIERYKD